MGELRDCDRDFLLFNPHWPPRGGYRLCGSHCESFHEQEGRGIELIQTGCYIRGRLLTGLCIPIPHFTEKGFRPFY